MLNTYFLNFLTDLWCTVLYLCQIRRWDGKRGLVREADCQRRSVRINSHSPS